jgi:IS4 transposase
MHKITNFTGQPVFNQLLKLLTRQTIEQLSHSIKGSEDYVKKLDGYKHLVIMLFAVFNHFDSLREIEIGMQAESHKFTHLGLDYMVRRSTLSEANCRRPSEFFAQVYALLLKRYAPFLADSRNKKEQKEWERLLYMMDSTTITLFDNILKGVGRHPKTGKKKGGMKVHTLMKYSEGVPMVVDLTSAAKHDHYLLKEIHLPKDSTLAIDRAYIDYAQFQRFTEEGVCYVTKMKKNLKYTVISSIIYVNEQGVVTAKEEWIVFEKSELRHQSRKIEIWEENTKQSVVLLTNNFEFSVEDLREIYKRRWAIETLYKQLKQNFPLHFFYGDSVNAIEIQTWVVLIANLLLTVMQQKIKRHCSFSQIVTMVRQTLMYYVDFIAFMENPNRGWQIISEEHLKSPPKIVQYALFG